MKEEQAIPEFRRLKDKWKKLYEEGKDKDKYERRALLRQMNRIEGDIAKISDKHILDAIDQLPDEELDAVWARR